MTNTNISEILITCGIDPSKFHTIEKSNGITIIFDHKTYFQVVDDFGLTVYMGKYWLGGNFEVDTKLVYGFSQDPEFYEELVRNLFKAWALGVR